MTNLISINSITVNKNKLLVCIFTLILFCGCSSFEQFEYLTREVEIPNKVFKATYTDTWTAVVATINKFDLELQNQESGSIKTKWIDNTLKLNFSDSFGSSDAVKAAKFKLIINVIKGFQNSKEVTKVTIYKRQLVNQDFLQGWKVIPSDQIEELTLLYRIERALLIDFKIKAIEKEKVKAEEMKFGV
jgi:hypothetical protein